MILSQANKVQGMRFSERHINTIISMKWRLTKCTGLEKRLNGQGTAFKTGIQKP